MLRCRGKTKVGRRCLKVPTGGSAFCSTHRGQFSANKALFTAVGAAIGNAIIPGLGGMAIGGIAGAIVDEFSTEERMAKKRAFVSFDFDNDRVLKDFIVGQAKLPDSPFEIIDHSLKEAAPDKEWEAKARAAIGRSEIVLVMVGAQTHRAHGVLKEVAMARAANVKIVQVIGYKNGDYTAVPDAGRLYAWNWDNLKKLLS